MAVSAFENVELSPTTGLFFQMINGALSDAFREFSVFNPTNRTLTYKVKRTLPKVISISPAYGYVKPLERVTFQVKAAVSDEADLENAARITVVVCRAPDNPPVKAKYFWFKYRQEMTKNIIPVKFEKADDQQNRKAEHNKEEEAENDNSSPLVSSGSENSASSSKGSSEAESSETHTSSEEESDEESEETSASLSDANSSLNEEAECKAKER